MTQSSWGSARKSSIVNPKSRGAAPFQSAAVLPEHTSFHAAGHHQDLSGHVSRKLVGG